MLTLMRGQKLHIINCNQHTETSDFLGGFRPVRSVLYTYHQMVLLLNFVTISDYICIKYSTAFFVVENAWQQQCMPAGLTPCCKKVFASMLIPTKAADAGYLTQKEV